MYGQVLTARCMNAIWRASACVATVLFACMLLMGIPVSALAETYDVPFKAWVFEIIDGDTIILATDRSDDAAGTTVRLSDIDCPEIDQDFGREARLAAETLLLHQDVVVFSQGKDKYRRTLATLKLPDGRIVNEELIRLGACWAYPYTKKGTILELQASAKETRRGLWARQDIESPWAFRKRQGLSKLVDAITGASWMTLSKRDKYLYIQGFLDGAKADRRLNRERVLSVYTDLTDLVVSRLSTEERQGIISELIRTELGNDLAELATLEDVQRESPAPVEIRPMANQPKFQSVPFDGPLR